MRAAPYSDGVPMVSQWPIEPGRYYDYELFAQTGDAGTYYYHSHVGYQGITAVGPLVVRKAAAAEAEAAKNYAGGEHVLLFTDFMKKTEDQLEKDAIQRRESQLERQKERERQQKENGGEVIKDDPKREKRPSADPVSQFISINGQSGRTDLGPGEESAQPHVFEVIPDKTYRFRFIGGLSNSMITAKIEGHSELVIVEADGQDTQPVSTDYVYLTAGQRYSALVTTKSEAEVGSTCFYWIRAETKGEPERRKSGYALLKYNTARCRGAKAPSLSSAVNSEGLKMVEDRQVYEQWMQGKLAPAGEAAKKEFPRKSTRTIIMNVNNGPWR